MSRLLSVVSVLAVVIFAMAFAAANAGNRVTLELGFVTLYRAPVTLVAFSGLLLGMLVMFAAGIHSDLKVRRILRDRLAEETRKEQRWVDRNQRDLFAQDPEPDREADREPDREPGPEAEPGVEPEVEPEVPPEPAAGASPEGEEPKTQ